MCFNMDTAYLSQFVPNNLYVYLMTLIFASEKYSVWWPQKMKHRVDQGSTLTQYSKNLLH